MGYRREAICVGRKFMNCLLTLRKKDFPLLLTSDVQFDGFGDGFSILCGLTFECMCCVQPAMFSVMYKEIFQIRVRLFSGFY